MPCERRRVELRRDNLRQQPPPGADRAANLTAPILREIYAPSISARG